MRCPRWATHRFVARTNPYPGRRRSASPPWRRATPQACFTASLLVIRRLTQYSASCCSTRSGSRTVRVMGMLHCNTIICTLYYWPSLMTNTQLTRCTRLHGRSVFHHHREYTRAVRRAVPQRVRGGESLCWRFVDHNAPRLREPLIPKARSTSRHPPARAAGSGRCPGEQMSPHRPR